MSAALGISPGPRAGSVEIANIELAIFDVDNTLVPNESEQLPDDEFLGAATEVEEGRLALLGLVSARQPQKVMHIIRAAKMRGFSILSNGAQIYDGSTGEMVVENVLPPEPTQAIMNTLRESGIAHWVQDDGVDHIWQGPEGEGYARPNDIWLPTEGTIAVTDYEPQKPFVIVAHNVTEEQLPSLQALGAEFEGDNMSCLVAHQTRQPDGALTYDMFFVDRRSTKEAALEKIAELAGITVAEIMVVGDGRNDSGVVGDAGIGVAMGNAVDETKRAATHNAPSQDEGGAAAVLKWLISSKKRQR